MTRVTVEFQTNDADRLLLDLQQLGDQISCDGFRATVNKTVDKVEDLVCLFPPEIRTASVVSRWSVVRTITEDTVANHSYYVAFYAHQIARAIDWTGPTASLMYMALIDDLSETITGDITGPVKSKILDLDRYDEYISRKMAERMPGVYVLPASVVHYEAEMVAIVKAADLLDRVLFLIVEQRMGNRLLDSRRERCEALLREAWYRLPGDPKQIERAWVFGILSVIRHHERRGGEGVED